MYYLDVIIDTWEDGDVLALSWGTEKKKLLKKKKLPLEIIFLTSFVSLDKSHNYSELYYMTVVSLKQ